MTQNILPKSVQNDQYRRKSCDFQILLHREENKINRKLKSLPFPRALAKALGKNYMHNENVLLFANLTISRIIQDKLSLLPFIHHIHSIKYI